MSRIVVQNIAEAKTYDEQVFPLTYQPAADAGAVGFAELSSWCAKNRHLIIKQMADHGCVLLRNFDLQTAEEMTSVVDSLGFDHMPYIGGAAVRNIVVGDRVFTTNESPPSEPIPFHHEMAQVPSPPSHLAFLCVVPSSVGGATPIIHSHQVYKFFSSTYPEFAAKVEKLGVKYVRVIPEEDDHSSAIGRGWKSTYLHADECKAGADREQMKQLAEKRMKEMGMTFEWLANGDCKTVTKTLPAVKVDKTTGLKTFFNSMVAAFLGWVDKRNDPLKAVVLGDDSPVDAEVLKGTAKFMESERVVIPWKKGDIMLIDNNLSMHSREPFKHPRKILAALMQGVLSDEKTDLIPHATLTSGTKMPLVGLGTWKISKEDCARTVLEAIKQGYRHFDCACDYGNEVEVGEGLKQAMASGLVKRSDLFITSKLWNTYHAKQHVKLACQKSLDDLGLDYLDLYLIHFPISLQFVPFETRYPPEWVHDPSLPDKEKKMEFQKVPISETWTAMEELVVAGLCKNIGVCNFNTSLIWDLLSYCKIKPAVNQVELHPYNTQDKLIQLCRNNGITVTGFSNFGASSYVQLNMASMKESVFNEPLVQELAKSLSKTPAQVVLRWAVQRGTVVIPKSSNPDRLKENLSVFDFCLTKDQMQAISNLNINKRFNDPGVFCSGMNTFCPIYD